MKYRHLDIRTELTSAFTSDVIIKLAPFNDQGKTKTSKGGKEEHTPANNTRTYEETFKSYVAKNPDK
ncbi:hypothetical protein MKY92_01030 [Paenibacillus sp. FSL R5-0623]|uniref:hypothetical protein n=1 Tax=Paenibacillus sp. FSL R5-0623 TaxID=2921651 RepID=UPI0030DAE1B2